MIERSVGERRKVTMDPYCINQMESREGLQNPSHGTGPFLKAGVGVGALKQSCLVKVASRYISILSMSRGKKRGPLEHLTSK